jgi:hypothetical protein
MLLTFAPHTAVMALNTGAVAGTTAVIAPKTGVVTLNIGVIARLDRAIQPFASTLDHRVSPLRGGPVMTAELASRI